MTNILRHPLVNQNISYVPKSYKVQDRNQLPMLQDFISPVYLTIMVSRMLAEALNTEFMGSFIPFRNREITLKFP